MKKKNNEKIEHESLTDEQLQFLTSQSNKEQYIPTDEPFDKSLKARTFRYVKKHKLFSAVIIILLISFLVSVSILLGSLVSSILSRPNTENFVVRIGDSKFTASYDDIYINDTMYIDMTKIASIDQITISGDDVSRKFTLPNLQYARFENESTVAVVDGAYLEMSAKAIISGNRCLLPMDFVTKLFKSGLVFTVDTEENIIKIQRNILGSDGIDKPVYEPLAFANELNVDASNIAYESFGFDSRQYLNLLDPQEDEYQILVNHSNPLSASYLPSDLVTITCDINPVNTRSYYQLRSVPSGALSLMMDAMKASGVEGVKASSAYRSYERQKELVDDYILSKMSTLSMSYKEAKNEVLKTSALPGHSEHQTGLCVDFVQGTTSLTNDFQYTTAFSWLKENAHKFGFILRYPENKESITGYNYEPWHYRFVGRTVASRIYEANICFEEYVALSKQF